MKSLVSHLPSPAMIVALVALVVALAGGATAGVLITGKQIRDGSLTGVDVRNNSLTGKDVRRNSLASKHVRNLQGIDIKDGTLTSADIAAGGVTGAEIADGSVSGSDLASGLPGSKIDVSSLGKVPQATAADTAAGASSLNGIQARAVHLVFASSTTVAFLDFGGLTMSLSCSATGGPRILSANWTGAGHFVGLGQTFEGAGPAGRATAGNEPLLDAVVFRQGNTVVTGTLMTDLDTVGIEGHDDCHVYGHFMMSTAA